MSTYVLSEHVRNTYSGGHRMAAAQAHPRLARATRWLLAFAAFVIGAAALAGGIVTLTGQGISAQAIAPSLILVALAGMAYMTMLYVFHHFKI